MKRVIPDYQKGSVVVTEAASQKLSSYTVPPACSCTTCQGMCLHRPCWGTPAEMQALINAGHGGKLMLNFWQPDERMVDSVSGDKVYILQPATRLHEGRWAPEIGFEGYMLWVKGLQQDPFTWPCAFLSPKRLCQLHDAGLKPIEGRLASCLPENSAAPGGPRNNVHFEVAQTWNTPQGRAVVKAWRAGRDMGKEPT